MIELPQPYLIFLGDLKGEVNAKTAFGIRDWAPQACAGQWALPGCEVDLGLRTLRPAEALAEGARSLLIGAAPSGGALPSHWIGAIVEALEAGLHVISGLHTPLNSIPEIAEAAQRTGKTLIDVRHGEYERRVGTGIKRTGKRLLTVGTDCALGKKYTALSITKAMQRRGWDATFRATGQTGIMISGAGVAIDSVVADFISGVAESLSPNGEPDHWDVIEGQGSLFHPAYAAVTLGLLHGSQPDAMVLCHHPMRERIGGFESFRLPTLCEALQLYEPLARRTNPKAQVVAIALNTKGMGQAETEAAIAAAQSETGLLAFDPIKHDLSPILALLEAI